MNTKRVAILLLLSTFALARPQGLTTVGLPSDSFDYVVSMQEQHEWCWAASTQMILKWLGFEVKQEELVKRIKGRVVDESASVRDITAALNIVSKRAGSGKVLHSVSVAGPPNPVVIVKELSQHIPMLLTISTGPQSGHCVVLTGARYHDTPKGPHIDTLIIRDPYPSPANMRTQGRVEISGRDLNYFVQTINRSWMVWVTDKRSTATTATKF